MFINYLGGVYIWNWKLKLATDFVLGSFGSAYICLEKNRMGVTELFSVLFYF